MVDRHLSKSVSKNPPPLPAQKLHGKAVLSYTLWLNSNKIDDINILQTITSAGCFARKSALL